MIGVHCAVLGDYEDPDYMYVDAMEAKISRLGGEVIGEKGGEEDNEFRVYFKCDGDVLEKIKSSASEMWEVW